ncbi:hypothetical protein GGF43_005633, partial [Coemansia sp. RSA 2618]
RQASCSNPYAHEDPSSTPGSAAQYAGQSRLASGVSSVTKTPTSLLRQMPDDKAALHPSPKKRAVSRGHHSNVPHPSPVYHALQSAATTVQVPSATTGSAPCFMQPLEAASVKYASSRYQQQRYDPKAAHATRAMPRASASIPSLRSGDAGSSAGSSRVKARHILRHQSTLPDMGRALLSEPGYAQPQSDDSAHSLLPMTSASALPQSLSSMMRAHLDAAALPTLPPPARLASGSYRSDYSPGNTLVYEQSPAAMSRTRASSRQPSESRHGLPFAVSSRQDTLPFTVSSRESRLDTLPVSALSALSVDSRTLQAAAEQLGCDYDADRTLSYAHADARSRHAAHDSANASSSGGWQLKSKILHPLSSWFRSSRHHSSSHSSPPSSLASAPKYVLAAAGSHKPCET